MSSGERNEIIGMCSGYFDGISHNVKSIVRTCRPHTRISYLMNVSIKMFSNPMAPQYSMDVVSNVQFQ